MTTMVDHGEPAHPSSEQLSEYLDDELAPGDRERIEVHASGCPTCRRELEALRAVTLRARSLSDAPPQADLWPGIADRITRMARAAAPRREAWRISFTLPQLVAAGLALVVLTAALVSLARLGGPRTDFPPVAAGGEAPADDAYGEAIADLERSMLAGRARLDEETLRVFDANLAAVDQAIEECRQALAGDPANSYLRAYLAEARWRKLELLRHAVAIAEKSG
jgi:hypothetical protein